MRTPMAEIEIPGYRLLREIDGGPGSRVHLANRVAQGGTVAVKLIDAPDEAAEAARALEHPNIVRILEVGEADGCRYRAMEHMRGGDLDRNLASGVHLQSLLMATKDIAAALDYAHRQGVVHGDLRPSNILFDEQGGVCVSGFALPAATDPRSPYQSPEQLAGEAPDQRSDFYSLGVILYQMLAGRLPSAPGSDRPQATVVRLHEPPLPPQFAAFRGVVDRLLANAPANRFGSGLEVAAALDGLRDRGALPDAVIRTEAVAAHEIDAAESTYLRERSTAAGEVGRSLRLRPPVLAAVLVLAVTAAAGVGYVSSQDGWIRALALLGFADNPDTVVAWEQAEDLREDRSQSLSAVVSAYRRVLAIEPGHVGALGAIDEVSDRWREEVESALDTADIGLADARLGELATVFPNHAALANLSDRLQDRRQATELLTATARLLARRGLADVRSAETAIANYKEVLRLDPGNDAAAEGLHEIAVHYGAAAAQVSSTDIAAAMDNLRRAESADAEFAGVDAVRETVVAAEAVHAEIRANLLQAADLRAAGALIAPPGANPLHFYRLVLATDPDNAIAQQGLSEISGTVLAQFDDLLRGGRLDAAREFKDQAAAAGLGDESVNEMAMRYDDELQRIDTANTLIANAELLYEQGYVTGPDAENNAVALLREALRLDPDNTDGLRLLSVSATRLANVAREAYSVGMTVEALEYLDLALTVTPGIGRWRAQRERWEAEIEQRPPIP